MKLAANFIIGGIVFTGLIVGGAILGAVAVYGLSKDEIDAGREALANRNARSEYQRYAYGQRYPFAPQYNVQPKNDESEEPES